MTVIITTCPQGKQFAEFWKQEHAQRKTTAQSPDKTTEELAGHPTSTQDQLEAQAHHVIGSVVLRRSG
jgi:hypothetical protein